MKRILLFISIGLAVGCSSKSSSNASVQLKSDPGLDTTLLTGHEPKSLLELPQSQDGEIILSQGFYEAEFKSYCLQPGTPDPGNLDAFTQMPLSGYRHEIVESILRRSLQHPELNQKHIQLLLWSTVSGSDYERLAPSVKQTARVLLSSREIFALQGGVAGVVKTVANRIPEVSNNQIYTSMRQLFDLGASSYEAYERVAVLRQPSIKNGNNTRRDQWHLQPQGYYVRYFPSGYQKTLVQVYVPDGLPQGKTSGEHYILFDPVTMMAVPTNSNAQRLGIGAPVADVIRQIIIIQKNVPAKKKTSKPAPPVNQNPKNIALNQ